MKISFIFFSAIFLTIPFLSLAQKPVIDGDILDEAYLKFNAADSLQRNQLIRALNDALFLQPNNSNSPEVLYKIIKLYQKDGETAAALINSFKLIIVYGNSPYVADVRVRADSILSENLTHDFVPEKPALINSVFERPAQNNFRLAYLDFISFLHAVSIPALDNYALDEIEFYKRFFIDNAENDFDAVLSWQADICLRQKKHVLAWITLQQLTNHFPHSSFVATGYLRLAHLALDIFHNAAEAKAILLKLINQLPESEQTAEAQYLLAGIFDYNLKSPKEALDNYLVLIKAFPECSFRADAMLRAAQIYALKKEYDNALALYTQIVEDYDRAPQVAVALLRIIYLDTDIFKNFAQAASNHLLLTQLFPKRKDRRTHLLKSAKLYLKIKKKKTANKIFHQIIKEYPHSQEAKTARKLIE